MFVNAHLTRQLDLVPIEILGTPIHIIGAGAVGSFTALTLAKMGFGSITVYDFDTVSVENMNCQFYRFSDIGKSKVVALHDLIRDFTRIEITAVNQKYEGRLTLPGVVVSAVDSMAVRRMIWEAHKHRAPATKMILDPRMGAESAMLYAMNPMDPADVASYEKTLYTDDSAVQEACTAKAIMYTASMLSGLVSKTVKDILVKTGYGRVSNWSIKDNQFLSWPKVVAHA